jgi:hypothetical protein
MTSPIEKLMRVSGMVALIAARAIGPAESRISSQVDWLGPLWSKASAPASPMETSQSKYFFEIEASVPSSRSCLRWS